MNNKMDNQTAILQSMVKEYAQHRQTAAVSTSPTGQSINPNYLGEILQYPIYVNSACPAQVGGELLQAKHDEGYCRRWLSFYQPDLQLLPHLPEAAELFQSHEQLVQNVHRTQSPRLAAFIINFFIIVFLTARGHFILNALPVVFLTWFWRETEDDVQYQHLQLARTRQRLATLRTQYWELLDQADTLPPPLPATELQPLFQQAAHRLLRQSLTALIPAVDLTQLFPTLQKRQWQVFALESWGISQLALQAAPELHKQIVEAKHTALTALLPASQEHAAIYRLTYLQLWLVTDKGLLLSNGFYDRVTDQFLHAQQAFIPYSNIAAFEVGQGLLPAQTDLQTVMGNTTYQTHWHQPVPIIRLHTKRGMVWQCAGLPLDSRAKPAPNTELAQWGFNTDLSQLDYLLHERLHLQQVI